MMEILTSNLMVTLPLIHLSSGDGCSSTCGIENGWSCSNSPSQCKRCGDAIIQYGETCDDNNTMAGDGCSPTCTIEIGW